MSGNEQLTSAQKSSQNDNCMQHLNMPFSPGNLNSGDKFKIKQM